MNFFLAPSDPSIMKLTELAFPSDDKSILCLFASFEERGQTMALQPSMFLLVVHVLIPLSHEAQFHLEMIIMISLLVQCIGQFAEMAALY